MINKQGGIRPCGPEPLLLEEGRNPVVPGPRCLLQPVERTGEQAHVVRIVGVDETSRLLTKHLLVEMAMQKSISHIELVNWPGARNAPYRTSGKSEARRRMPVPAFSVYCRWRPASSS